MKKLMLILSTLLAFACTKVETYIPQEVEFTNTITTKAIVEGTAAVDNFGVYGYVKPVTDVVDGGWFMNNVEYKADGTVAGTTHYFWPKAGDDTNIKVNFFVYSPYSSAVSMTGDNITIPIDASNKDNNCVDLLYAFTNDSEPTETKVPISFKHQLAWVRFQACFTGNLSDVKINNITFNTPLKTKGSAVINTTDNSISLSTDGTTTAFNLGNSSVSLSTEYKTLSDILVIPQTAPTSVTIKYSAKIAGITYSNKTATVSLATTEFKRGTQYIYQINISVWEVLFATSVSDWDKQTPAIIY